MGFAEAMAAIEAAWSLQSAGFEVFAFRREGTRPPLRRVRGVNIHPIPAPEQDAIASRDAVRALVHRVRPSAVLPLDDHAVWLCSDLETGARLAGANGPAAECALDKSIQVTYAERAGLPVPPTRVLNDVGDAGPIGAPVMIKPARALYELDGRLIRPTGTVCANDEELQRAAARSWHAPMLMQPLIRGTGEGLFGHVGPRGAVAWSAHRRVRMVNPQGSASSACRSQPIDRQLVEPSERFLHSIGWRGMFMLEFLRDGDGTPWFMELNGRAWGSMALARRRGFEYPAWTVKDVVEPGFEPTPPAAPIEILCRNLGLEIVHLMFVARGPQSDASTEWPRLRRAVRDVCRLRPDDRWYNWNRSEPSVLVADTVSTLGVYLRKLRSSPGA
jgi:hypothetical protein